MPTDSNLFRPLNTKRAFDEISDQIRELIYSGVFKPGDKLPSERELGNQFKTGRMVVREALRTLEQAGLIYIKQGSSGGAFIRHADGKVITSSFSDMIKIGNVSLEELTEARLGIEKIVLELSINKITRDDLHLLENNIKDSEEQISELFNHLRIAAGLAAGETLEGGEYEVRWMCEVEGGLHAVEVIGSLGGKLAILHLHPPLAAPLAVHNYADGDVHTFGCFLIHGAGQQGQQHVRYQHTGSARVQLGILLAQPPSHVPRVNSVVHDVESGIEESGQRAHVWMHDEEVAPLIRG